MTKQEITLPDGRYLIYYTFEDTADGSEGDRHPEPLRHPEPVEGRPIEPSK